MAAGGGDASADASGLWPRTLTFFSVWSTVTARRGARPFSTPTNLVHAATWTWSTPMSLDRLPGDDPLRTDCRSAEQQKRREKRRVRRDAFAAGFGGRCVWCGEFVTSPERTREHLHPRSQGGGMRRRNLALAHRACNQARDTAQWVPRYYPEGA